MARLAERLAENADGDLYVDRSCIDCETCRQIAPAVFGRDDAAGQSIVRAQPANAADERRALMALVACPTASIGSAGKRDLGEAARAFPEEIADGVYYCGYASEWSYGASSYLIRRTDGNILVDSPRAARPLVRRLEEMGGVRLMFLTHRDDVADHEKFRRAFGCERILHAADVGAGTRAVERQPAGAAPLALADDLTMIPVPGHTRGSMALLYRDRFLFTGDHLWGDEDEEEGDGEVGSAAGIPRPPAAHAVGHGPAPPARRLGMSRSVCWYSWAEQLRSLRRLLDHRFEWVLPGHGRPFHAGSQSDMRAAVEALLAAS
jgi:glyoxylase-like metal-dependent hydrolase (beta-lactamase superfamily II)/ferredoxin